MKQPTADRSRGQRWQLVALLVLSLGLALPVSAQTQRSGGGGSSQIMQQYQQLASERTALQSENAKLKSDLAAMTGERDALKKERDALKAHAGGAEANQAKIAAATLAADQRLTEQRSRMEELVARYRETGTSLQNVEKERNRVQSELDKRTQAYSECAVTNVKLGSLFDEVLQRYSKQGWFHKATIDEPFTGITRNRVENLVGEYRARAAELKVPALPAPDATLPK